LDVDENSLLIFIVREILVLDIEIFKLEFAVVIVDEHTMSFSFLDFQLLDINGQEGAIATFFLIKGTGLEDLALNALLEGFTLSPASRTLLTISSGVVSFGTLETPTLPTNAFSSSRTDLPRLGVQAGVSAVSALTSITRPVSMALALSTVTGSVIGSRADFAIGSITTEVVTLAKLAVDSLVKGLLITFTDSASTYSSPRAGFGVFVSVASEFISRRIRLFGITFTVSSVSIAVTRADSTLVGAVAVGTLLRKFLLVPGFLTITITDDLEINNEGVIESNGIDLDCLIPLSRVSRTGSNLQDGVKVDS
jgi:hypothetical protein